MMTLLIYFFVVIILDLFSSNVFFGWWSLDYNKRPATPPLSTHSGGLVGGQCVRGVFEWFPQRADRTPHGAADAHGEPPKGEKKPRLRKNLRMIECLCVLLGFQKDGFFRAHFMIRSFQQKIFVFVHIHPPTHLTHQPITPPSPLPWQIRGDCKQLALQFNLPYREMNFYEAVKLMLGGLWTTGQEELALRKSYVAAAAAVMDKLHAD